MRNGLLALIVTMTFATAAPAQQQAWAEKMFKDGILVHDFGPVPHGAQLFHRFTITNIYAVRMEITSCVPNCGCVTATRSKLVLAPREEATIDVQMDARNFTALKKVNIRGTVGPDFRSAADPHFRPASLADITLNS